MILPITSANRQVAGFAVATVAWILSSISMGLVEWRVWYMDNPSLSYSGIAMVGMWRVCVYHHDNNSSKVKMCHQYTYYDTFLPPDIRVSQHLLLSTNILGLFGRALVILALKNVYLGILQKNVTYNLFVISGILNITASGCVSIAVLWNYYSITNMEGIDFTPYFHVPFKPNSQEFGSATLVATLAAFLFLLSGTTFLSYSFPPDIQVHPDV
ncbi:claudin-34-like [Dipodomys spectabilis]|uniref:claudin-34-like n=1 Tax=Dipodomys spectabilis TaxID=105255 RepID=UPI001C53838C|nr:claudin-34-like [Dipodomys spectabilis]XP_042544970.1 claudin-34-like [Dipodomys spectabilis]